MLESPEREKAMRNARRSGSNDPREFFTPKEYDLYSRCKKDVNEFKQHLQLHLEEEAKILASTRSGDALRLLMIESIEKRDVKEFIVRCYARAVKQAMINNVKTLADPFGRESSATEDIT
eukprot:3009161-Amphidinium_carterae.1